jgi:hypothetical protein
MCIGGPYIMGLIQAVPQRVASAVVFQTIGLHNNRQAFFEMFDSWANELKPRRSDVSADAWESFKQSMYSGEFLFNVSREFVSTCQTPLLGWLRRFAAGQPEGTGSQPVLSSVLMAAGGRDR